jgi:hypothetical protein
MWRDIRAYVKAVVWQWVSFATGVVVSLGLLMSQVFDIAIPRWAFGTAAVVGILVAGFRAWRDERRKVAPTDIDPELELRRPPFERAIAKLNPEQEGVLAYVLGVGDSDAIQLRDNYFREQLGRSVSAHDADMLLTTIAETGLLEVQKKGNAYGRYRIRPVWTKLGVEWAAPPTVVDKRIADKARQLRRTLAASFEDWPTGLKTLDDLTTWAGKLIRGFGVTEAALKEIIELRPEASRRFDRAVETASGAYYAAADVLNRLFKGGGLSIQWDERPAIETQLRGAVAHVEQCLAALETLIQDRV